MKLTSYGAAQTVTGSKHMLEVNGYNILFDCGMFQGARKESEHRNRELPFNPKELDAVVLSHAHIDHSGILPMLAKYGYKGPVFTTPATRDLCSIMLLDSSHIQERDAEWLSKKHQTFVGFDATGQDHDPRARTIVWTALPGRHGIFVPYRSEPIRPVKDSISVWLRGRTTSTTDWAYKADFDDFALRRVQTGVPGVRSRTVSAGDRSILPSGPEGQ